MFVAYLTRVAAGLTAFDERTDTDLIHITDLVFPTTRSASAVAPVWPALHAVAVGSALVKVSVSIAATIGVSISVTIAVGVPVGVSITIAVGVSVSVSVWCRFV